MFSIRPAVPGLLISLLATTPARAQGPMDIVVNIPAGRLEVFQGDRKSVV